MSNIPGTFSHDSNTHMVPADTHGAIPHDTTMVDAPPMQPSHRHDTPMHLVITSSTEPQDTEMGMASTSNAPVPTGRLLIQTNKVQAGHQHEEGDRRSVKKQAIGTPQRDEMVNLRYYAEQVKNDVKVNRRQKRETEKKWQMANTLLETAQKESENWARRWKEEQAVAEAWRKDLGDQFVQQLNKKQHELMVESQRVAKAAVAVREAELKETIARAKADNEAEKHRLHALEEKRKAEYETKIGAFRTCESPQRRGVGHRNDDSVPDGAPIHTTELVSPARREQCRVETLMHEGGNHFPVFTVAAPTAGPSVAAPAPDSQHTGQSPLQMSQDVLQQMITEAVAAKIKKKKASPKKKRNVQPAVRVELDTAKKWQQERMSADDDHKWKRFINFVWYHAQGREKADHFDDYDPASEATMLTSTC
ncbi:hypothetical protein B0H17DRAFT_1150357 [Mycena rosella]|uniref:Uncharacterized protein n=1 Tax=Mycena rosella TaxID=1033263 RepID=A0AAD7FN53_MYCRO|nr:hypothetical protein B0H17DRAFT_1150357 [Mycena rosella]